MFARLLVRWPAVALHAHARRLCASSLVRAPNAAAVMRPRLADEPLVEQDTNRAHFSSSKFADAPISSKSKMAIPHEFMSDVQEATLELGLSGVDLLVQAKTGTGKTMAFLLPAIEQLAKKPVPRSGNVSILVLSPTRELAMQIQKEADTLVRNHPFRVQTLIGGTSIGMQKQKLAMRRCDVLVATPGRLLDLLESTDLSKRLHTIQTVVLDEADRLLDVGFKDTLNAIFKYLPDRDQNPRQCMLYSATLSRDVKEIAALYLTPDHKFVSTLAEDEVNTHEHVPQTCVTVPISDTLKATFAILQEDTIEYGNRSKAMVFCTTAWGTSATAKLLEDAGHGTLPPIFEIHSRMTQNRRLAVAQNFKRAKSGILVTSDVTARGMDFPGVTLVVQVGLPSSSEQYIHRLGRTARAGRSGRGVIILTPQESGFLRTREMRALPIQPHPQLQLPSLSPSEIGKTLQIQAYGAWLGFNVQYTRQLFRSRQQFVNEANKYARDVLGWTEEFSPPISPATARNLGIHGLDGVNTNSNEFGWESSERSSSGGPSRNSSWRESDRPNRAFGQFQRSPRQDTYRRPWQGGEASEDGFKRSRSFRQDTDERSSYRRSSFGYSRSPRRFDGRQREQGWGEES